MTAPDAIAALLAVLGAGGLGFTVGCRRERASARADVDTWRELATSLHAENGRLRCEGTPVPSGTESPSGAPNALHRLRKRLGFARGEVAQALGIPVAEVDTLEHTRLALLEVGTVADVVSSMGCRLDVVAQHIDGEAVWLSDEQAATATRRFPPTVRLKTVTGPVVDGESGHDWEVTDLAGRFLAAGWSPGSESDAREAALQALEAIDKEGGPS
jgi:hypothetical protein